MVERRLRFLPGRDVAKALPMREAVEAMKEAFRQLSAGEAVAPPRTHIAVKSPPGDALFMPAYVPATGKMGLRIVTLFGGNAARGLPRIQALVIVVDAANPRADHQDAQRHGQDVSAVDGNVCWCGNGGNQCPATEPASTTTRSRCSRRSPVRLLTSAPRSGSEPWRRRPHPYRPDPSPASGRGRLDPLGLRHRGQAFHLVHIQA
jgi:hypothetical protein